ncbi:MAG: cytochrome-c peroxidase [bacterium]
MKRIATVFFVWFSLFIVTSYVYASENAGEPITLVSVQSLGPQRIGNLPPVPVPVNNPQTSMKILLGKQLYFDTRLSKDNTVSCATCHNPFMGWSDAGPTSVGIRGQVGPRRAPPVSNAAYNHLQFWDGRAASLEEQAQGPIQNPVEMGNTLDNVVKTLNSIPGYVKEFKDVFGATPITIDQVVDAIASFERTVVTTDSPFDRYIKGDRNALTPLEKEGMAIFNGKGHCTACHWGGYFSDGRFHNLGTAQTGPLKIDNGRYAVTGDPKDMRAFKTPTIRDVALRPPYMHDGSEMTLEQVVDFYNRGGGDDPNLDPLIVPLGLTAEEKRALIAFMARALTSTNPEVSNVKPIPVSELPK